MADITYCVNRFCPFEDCDRHLENVKGMPPETLISVAPLDGTCRRYLDFLLEEEQAEADKQS